MGFSFGAGAAPAPAAPAPSTGFGFGGAPSTTTTSTAPSTAPSSGFSLGATMPAPAAAAPAATATAPAPAGGLFGATASNNATQSTTAATFNNNANTVASANNNANDPASAAQPKSIATIPPCSTSFPRLTIQRRVEASLARWKHHCATDADGSGSATSFAARELIDLLSVEHDNTAEGGEGPVGQFLADPTSILKFSVADAALRGQLQPLANAPQNAAYGAPNNATAANTDTSYITLKGQLTAVTPQIAKEVLQLSDELKMSEVEALSLYAEAMSIVGNNNDVDLVEQSKNGGEEDDAHAFLRMLIKGGKVGYDTNKKTDAQNNPTMANNTQQPPFGQNQQLEQAPQQDQDTSSFRIRTAQRLFFQERSSLLSTIFDLIRHRVEAAHEITSGNNGSSSDAGMGAYEQDGDGHNAVLVATDQLLNAGLVSNLIRTARELTGMTKEIGESLRVAERNAANAVAPPARPAPVAAAPASAFGGLFGAAPAPAPTCAFGTPAPTAPVVHATASIEMQYALLGFTHLQRQIACECLFYLAYHTQLEVEEVCGLIDLVKELTNGDGNQGGLPLLDPLIGDVPFPYEDMLEGSVPGSVSSPWGQPQHPAYGANNFGGQWNHFTHAQQMPRPSLKNPQLWQNDLITSLWKRGTPQLLQATSTLIMSIICGLDARYTLLDRNSSGGNLFGVGNALFPPQNDPLGGNMASSTRNLQPIHQRLDPENSSAEESWKRCDIWGLLLIPYALLLRNAAPSQLLSPRGSPVARQGGGIDIKGTYSKCLMVASQLKSLTFARCSLVPSLSSSSAHTGSSSAQTSSSFEFYFSTLAEFTSQYIDALGTTGNLPITRKEWLDEEVNSSQSEWMERDQKRQFGLWTGQETETQQPEEEEGPRPINVMDRPDCLEDVFSLVSSVCECYPAGAKAFWYIVEEERSMMLTDNEAGVEAGGIGDGAESNMMESSLVLAPSRALQTLDLLSENESSLYVYLSFLASLALSDGTDEGTDEASNGASTVHAFLSGSRAINPTRGTTDRRMQLQWDSIVGTVRWYAETLGPSEESAEEKKSSSIRRSSSTTDASVNNESTSYYYGAGSGGASSANVAGDAFTPESSSQGGGQTVTPSNSSESAPKLDELGRATLKSLLALLSNVALHSSSAREHLLSIQLPAMNADGNNAGGYQDGALEILFGLLTVKGLEVEIMGMCFVAIGNLLQPTTINNGENNNGVAPSADAAAGSSRASAESSMMAAAMRAWELLELCQFLPIKLLSQFSSYAAGTGALPRSTSTFTTTKTQGGTAANNDLLPSSTFPESNDYGMIYQFEHVESKTGSYPATEGFLYLLSTLIKVAGCPSTLGSQWRLRPGCAPYIEYVTDFVLPRATNMDKHVTGVQYKDVSDECRLVNRALEVVEAVIVRYAVPPVSKQVTFQEVKDYHRKNVKVASVELGLAPIIDEIFCDVDSLTEDEMNFALQDFRNECLPQDNVNAVGGPAGANRNQNMLEASFGNPVPLPKTPGFAILSNLLSTNRGMLFQIITKLLSENGGSHGIHEYNERIHSKSLATSLFRETPPTLACAQEGTVAKSRREHDVIKDKEYQAAMSTIQQSMIQPLDPLLLLSYFGKSYCSSTSENNPHGASTNDAVLWRERTLLLSLRILCAAAAREEAFIQSVKEATTAAVGSSATPAPLSVVPTLLFKGPIHGSFAHRFMDQETVSVSRLCQLLTKASSSAVAQHKRRYLCPEILPVIVEYAGYSACALPDPEGIARGSFSIISYITHTMPHGECTHSLCGNVDVNGVRLAHAFSKGLSSSLHSSDVAVQGSDSSSLGAYILDLILSNIKIVDSTMSSANLNLSLMMLGLGGSRHNCLNGILELISDSNFVLDPKTSSSATKCFELIFRVCELGGSTMTEAPSAPNNAVRAQQLLLMNKLRRGNFWHTQVGHYLGMRGSSTPSIFHEIANSYSLEHGDGMEISSRDNDVVHSISWLLKGLAIELHSLAGQQHESTLSSNQFHTLIDRLLSQPNSLLLTALIDMPLGQSSNGFIQERLHIAAAPPRDVLKGSSRPMSGPVEICAGYEIIDIERLLCHVPNDQSIAADRAREWATAWNSFVCRVCASSHLSQAWSDVVRTALIYSPMVNTRAVMDILCTILLRLSADVEAECAMPLSIAALGLTDILIESSHDTSIPNVQEDAAGYSIAEEDVGRVCVLFLGAISSCTEGGTGMSSNDGRAAVLSCALTRMLVFSEEADYSVLPQNTPSGILDVYANAVSFLFRLSTAPVFGSYANSHQAKAGAIALAARSGLSSLFGHLKSIEDHGPVSELVCSKIFNPNTTAAIQQLADLIACNDNDVAYLLQQIAMFHDGVRSLANSEVTTKLLDCAKKYSLEEHSYLSSHLGTSGASQLKPPSLLQGHLSLLNGLLSSPLTSSERVALSVHSYQLLKVYCGTFERMVQLYPTYNNLTIKFTEALYLTYTSLKESTESSVLGSTLLNIDDSLLTLENSVLLLACQLSAFPLPVQLLPPLPMELVNVEKIHASKMKNIDIDLGKESTTWWDNVPHTTAKKGQSLPSPPTGSFDVVSQHRFTSYQHSADSVWSEGKYQHAISAAKCLEMSTSFLISRVNFVTQRDLPTFSIDAVAIAKGICRCSDASRAIQDRLFTLKSHPEEDITTMLDASNVMNEARRDQPLSRALKLEPEYLFQLGSVLGQCAEKMVCLALQDARRVAARSYTLKPENPHEWAYFIGAMTPALDHTEMETKGVGCALKREGAEASMALAQALRQEIDKIRTVLQ